jgi:hypothetical protein
MSRPALPGFAAVGPAKQAGGLGHSGQTRSLHRLGATPGLDRSAPARCRSPAETPPDFGSACRLGQGRLGLAKPSRIIINTYKHHWDRSNWAEEICAGYSLLR